jgi:hypothetical protein
MGQVIFWRARQGVRRRDAKHRASAVAVSTDVGLICAGKQRAARTRTRASSQDTDCRPICHYHKLGEVRCLESPAGNAVPGLRTRRVTLRESGFRRLVTLTSHRRNAKNIFTERMLGRPVVSSDSTRNVALSSAKFHKYPAVSDAVETLIDCLMLNKNCPVHSPYRSVGTAVTPRTTLHHPGASWQRNEDGGAP